MRTVGQTQLEFKKKKRLQIPANSYILLNLLTLCELRFCDSNHGNFSINIFEKHDDDSLCDVSAFCEAVVFCELNATILRDKHILLHSRLTKIQFRAEAVHRVRIWGPPEALMAWPGLVRRDHGRVQRVT
jgi:hypothetical protein